MNPTQLTILLILTPLLLTTAAHAESPTWRSTDAAQKPLTAAAGDRQRARHNARRFASNFAALSQPPGPAEHAPRHAETQQRVATIQPHYAVTHPWVQRPVAHAGWYVPPPIRPRPRPIILIDRRPIIIQPHFHLPRHPWWWRPRPWRSDRRSRW